MLYQEFLCDIESRNTEAYFEITLKHGEIRIQQLHGPGPIKLVVLVTNPSRGFFDQVTDVEPRDHVFCFCILYIYYLYMISLS